MSIGSSFGDAFRGAGKHVGKHAVKKTGSGYGKANKLVKKTLKAGGKKSVSYFKAAATKSERDASKARTVKRGNQVCSLRRIK